MVLVLEIESELKKRHGLNVNVDYTHIFCCCVFSSTFVYQFSQKRCYVNENIIMNHWYREKDLLLDLINLFRSKVRMRGVYGSLKRA